MTDAVEGRSETGKQEMQAENTEGTSYPTVSPAARRKSWRRATITRRSLPVILNPYRGEMSAFLHLVFSKDLSDRLFFAI